MPLALCLALLGCGPVTGCVKVYQPVSGLHRPVVVDPQLANFQDVRLTVYCPPGELVDPEEARALCRKVGTLFENQGARVSSYTTDRRLGDDPLGGDPTAGGGDEPGEPAPTDLIMELRGRQVHQATNQLSWLLFIGTFTLVPAVSEFTFAQDVVIRDESGFLLLSDTLQGRIIRYSGAGTYFSNKLLDWFWREEEDKLLVDDMPHSDLSADFYGQLSQLLFNAKLRWQVLEEANPATRAD